MAPDLNSVPPSPRQDRNSALAPTSSTPASRRTSQIMSPPPAPISGSHSHSSVHTYHGPHMHRSPVISSNELAGVPLRHPRPLTAVEMYMECEKEQEAVVNRLTRELTALRAQSASVASNASHSSTSTSASLLPVDITDPNPTHQMTGATHPTPSRRHRSSSSVSSRSIPTPSTAISSTGSVANVSTVAQAGSTTGVPIRGISQASADRAAAAAGAGMNTLSRQASMSASGTSTPARQSLDLPRPAYSDTHQHRGTLYTLPHRPSLSRDASFASQNTSSTATHAGTPFQHPLPSPAQSPSQSVHAAMQHYADTAAYRSEMEMVKTENEALRQRVRGLERALRARRRDSSVSDAPRPNVGRDRDMVIVHSAAGSSTAGVAGWDSGVGRVAGPRERSESQSTTASSRRGGGLAVDDEVRLGESAGSMGVGRGM